MWLSRLSLSCHLISRKHPFTHPLPPDTHFHTLPQHAGLLIQYSFHWFTFFFFFYLCAFNNPVHYLPIFPSPHFFPSGLCLDHAFCNKLISVFPSHPISHFSHWALLFRKPSVTAPPPGTGQGKPQVVSKTDLQVSVSFNYHMVLFMAPCSVLACCSQSVHTWCMNQWGESRSFGKLCLIFSGRSSITSILIYQILLCSIHSENAVSSVLWGQGFFFQ